MDWAGVDENDGVQKRFGEDEERGQQQRERGVLICCARMNASKVKASAEIRAFCC